MHIWLRIRLSVTANRDYWAVATWMVVRIGAFLALQAIWIKCLFFLVPRYIGSLVWIEELFLIIVGLVRIFCWISTGLENSASADFIQRKKVENATSHHHRQNNSVQRHGTNANLYAPGPLLLHKLSDANSSIAAYCFVLSSFPFCYHMQR